MNVLRDKKLYEKRLEYDTNYEIILEDIKKEVADGLFLDKNGRIQVLIDYNTGVIIDWYFSHSMMELFFRLTQNESIRNRVKESYYKDKNNLQEFRVREVIKMLEDAIRGKGILGGSYEDNNSH